MARIRIEPNDLINYAWLRHFAGVTVSDEESKQLYGLHLDIEINGLEAYYDTDKDELYIPDHETKQLGKTYFLWLSQYAKKKKSKIKS
jgi:hypothetical protein